MNPDQKQKKNIFHRIGESLSKNYRIIRMRVEIGHIEKKKAAQYELLGKRLMKLIETNRIKLPEQKKLMGYIHELERLQKEKIDLLVKMIQS